MKKYLERILGKKASIQRKVVVVYLLIAVLPIMLITLLASIIYYNSILKSSYGLLEQNERQHEIVVQERMDAYENVLYELVTNREYISLARAVNTEDEQSFLVDNARMERLLRSCVYTYDGIKSVTFLADNGRYVTYSKWYESANGNIWSDEKKREEVHNRIEEKQKLTFIATVNLSKNGARDDYVILMGYPVRDLRTQKQSGILVMALEDDVLLFDNNINSLESQNPTAAKTQPAGAEGVTTVILDDRERILAGVDSAYVNYSLTDYLEEVFDGGKGISRKQRKIEGTEWTIVNLIDTDVYRREIYHLVRLVFVLTAVITCVFFLIVFFLSRKYIGTIQKIAQSLHDYEGTGAEMLQVEVSEEDELYVIVRQFHKMTFRINSLVETLKRKNEEIRAAAASQKHAEIKALEAQINPHFLFNTLDSINWRAIENDEEEISDMLGALGSLLRYSVSNIERLVVLEAEIGWLKKYIFLQRDRFSNSFDCSYDVTQEAMAFPIYKMLLQPIIENAILHAFEDVKKGGMIYVKAFIRPDKRLEIRIRDNGCGMTEETLLAVRGEIRKKGPLNGKSIGISNVVRRLRIYYREEAEITVESSPGKGTEFILIIPEKREGEVYENHRDCGG